MSTSTRDVNSMNTFDFWDNGTILSYKICKAVNALSAIDSVIREGVDHPSNYAMGLSFITETLTECAGNWMTSRIKHFPCIPNRCKNHKTIEPRRGNNVPLLFCLLPSALFQHPNCFCREPAHGTLRDFHITGSFGTTPAHDVPTIQHTPQIWLVQGLDGCLDPFLFSCQCVRSLFISCRFSLCTFPIPLPRGVCTYSQFRLAHKREDCFQFPLASAKIP